jgi:peptidoglycan hydrolase CwlO-like protein
MAEEKKEKWLNYLALTTVIFAVCATLSTFKGGGFGSRALLNQTNATNQWSYYQSKSIKSYIFENQVDNLELQMDIISKTSNNKEDLEKYQSKIDGYNKKLKKYEQEKAEIKAEAEKYEKQRDLCQNHAGKFGIAVIFLQVSILLSSIAGLMKKRPVWYLSSTVGVIGIFYFLNGFFLWV